MANNLVPMLIFKTKIQTYTDQRTEAKFTA